MRTIRLGTDAVFPLREAPRKIAEVTGLAMPSLATVYRWSQAGIGANDGSIVRLETLRVGGRRVTSIGAVQAFCERLSAAGTEIEGAMAHAGHQLEAVGN